MEKKLTSIKKANPHQDLIQARKESMKKINESNEKSFEWLNENSKKNIMIYLIAPKANIPT